MGRRFRDTFPRQSAMPFVSNDLVLLAVAELFVPVLDDRYSNPHGSACGSASQISPLASLNGRYDPWHKPN